MGDLCKRKYGGVGEKNQAFFFGWHAYALRMVKQHSIVDPKLLEILVCPVTKAPLRYDAETQELISEKAELAYPIRDGIPIMLPEEARKLSS